MKRYLFLGIFCLFSLLGMAEYYYYHGEKIPIIINADSVVLYTLSNSRALDDNSILSTTIARNKNSIYHENKIANFC